jgi:AcrR family transcriptional regulator
MEPQALKTPRRLTRQQQKAETRDRLLEAARRVFARRGFHKASVSEVATEAGFTVGAVYAHFESKDDLFLELLEQHVEERLALYSKLFEGGRDLHEQASRGADRWMAFLRDEPDFFPLSIEFWAHAVRNPELRRRYASSQAEFHEAFAHMIERGAEQQGIAVDPEEAARLGTVVNALALGLSLEKGVNPDAVPDELLGTTLSLFFRGLLALAVQGEDVGLSTARELSDDA